MSKSRSMPAQGSPEAAKKKPRRNSKETAHAEPARSAQPVEPEMAATERVHEPNPGAVYSSSLPARAFGRGDLFGDA